MFAKDYTKAPAVADHAHALFPDNLGIQTNRAHALMFMGTMKRQKRSTLFTKGSQCPIRIMSYGSKSSLTTFEKLRKAGLTNPMMADIDKELGISR